MGNEIKKCCGDIFGDDKPDINIVDKVKSFDDDDYVQSYIDIDILEQTCHQLDKLIQRDPGKRGIENLHIPGELKGAVLTLFNAKHVIIATGFPCCIKAPHTESDGPPGAILLAYSLLKQQKKVTMMIDSVNKVAIEPLVDYFNKISELKNKLELYVCSDYMNVEKHFVENKMFEDVDVFIATELAGFGSDGKYKTMSAKDITDKCGKTAVLFDYANKNMKHIRTIGIGDGGNESGMGKVIENVRKHIEKGDEIGCIIGCNYLITAGVSNWGTEAIGVALGSFCSLELHKQIYLKASELGCIDGITGKGKGSVDGLSYSEHAQMYKDLCDIYMQNQV
eukprot:441966_1